jgi:hypothetical protein
METPPEQGLLERTTGVPRRRRIAGHTEDQEDEPGFQVDRRELPATERIHALAATLRPLWSLLVLLAAYSGTARWRWWDGTQWTGHVA